MVKDLLNSPFEEENGNLKNGNENPNAQIFSSPPKVFEVENGFKDTNNNPFENILKDLEKFDNDFIHSQNSKSTTDTGSNSSQNEEDNFWGWALYGLIILIAIIPVVFFLTINTGMNPFYRLPYADRYLADLTRYNQNLTQNSHSNSFSDTGSPVDNQECVELTQNQNVLNELSREC